MSNNEANLFGGGKPHIFLFQENLLSSNSCVLDIKIQAKILKEFTGNI